jgi:hypothetical protein
MAVAATGADREAHAAGPEATMAAAAAAAAAAEAGAEGLASQKTSQNNGRSLVLTRAVRCSRSGPDDWSWLQAGTKLSTGRGCTKQTSS